MNIELRDSKEECWRLVYELYIRINTLVATRVAKCIESKDHSFVAKLMKGSLAEGGEGNV